MCLAVGPVSIIYIAIRKDHSAFTVRGIVLPGPFKKSPVRPDLLALSMSQPIFVLTDVDNSVLVLERTQYWVVSTGSGIIFCVATGRVFCQGFLYNNGVFGELADILNLVQRRSVRVRLVDQLVFT